MFILRILRRLEDLEENAKIQDKMIMILYKRLKKYDANTKRSNVITGKGKK